jgi:phytoene synthase
MCMVQTSGKIIMSDLIRLAEAYRYCRQLTKRSDSNFALSFRFLPQDKRNAIYAVYAFNRCADDFADELSDSSESLNKLKVWERMLHECYEGNAPQHPVMVAFTDTIKRFNIPKKPFQDAINGFKMDLTVNRYKTFDDLLHYCDLVAGTISTVCLHVFGMLDDKAILYGKYLSYALQLTNIIRDVGKDTMLDRVYIPIEELKRFHYNEEDLLSRSETKNFYDMMKFQIERAHDYYVKANPLIKLISPDSRFTVVIIGATYNRLLEKIKEQHIPVLHNVVRVTKWEKIRLITARLYHPKFA